MLSKQTKGLSLINALVGISIIVIAGVGIYSVFNFALRILAENKARTTAIAIANEKMELIRNLSYNDVGTASGIPSGIISQNETLIRNGISFNINTQIFYTDDPFDGLQGGYPDDTLNTDYKKVKIAVSWPTSSFGQPVIIGTQVAPKGIETTAGGGTIKILVFDANGLPVPQADIHLENNALIPSVVINTQANPQGVLLVPGAIPSQESYEVTVTKTENSIDYSTDKTYPITVELPVPTKPHASVIESEVTEISFAIDVLATLQITTVNKEYPDNFQINTDEGTEDQTLADVAIDASGNYYFVWQDYRDSSSPRIYSQKYNSNKIKQWAADLRISTAVNQINPTVSSDGTDIYIAWNDDREGNQDSYLIKLNASGVELWGGDRKLDVTAQSADQIVPSLAVATSTGSAYVAFQDNRDNDWDIYIHKYDTNGNLAWTQEKKINGDIGDAEQYTPQIALDNNENVYIAWQDKRNVNPDIYLHKFDKNSNALWLNEQKINTDSGTAEQFRPQIAVYNPDVVYIAWYEDRNGDYDIYLHKYDKDGSAIWPAEIKVNNDTTNADQTNPAIGIDSLGNIYIAWTDNRYGQADIYAQKYDSSGNPLWVNDERINLDSGVADQGAVAVAVDSNDRAVFSWHDNRGGDYNIYAATYDGPGTIIPISNVPLIITGTKTIYVTPLIYKYDNNHITNASGNLTLSAMEWDSYNITPQATSSYTLISSEPPQPINLEPGETINVMLNLE
ncbi:hypothetical protein KKD20_03310 [Patescibacteria group bacterium]|nr:hypothetical protein [Patescibacteria group bacterium]